jgi:hypothetical protein
MLVGLDLRNHYFSNRLTEPKLLWTGRSLLGFSGELLWWAEQKRSSFADFLSFGGGYCDRLGLCGDSSC